VVNPTILAIIPARGGSKRLAHKNKLFLKEKPLIAWSIESAIKSKYITDVVVTSDDNGILKIAKDYGAKTIMRPENLANDTATTFDAIKHTIEHFNSYDYIILLQPTSPLRNQNHIDEAWEVLLQKKADAIVSICEMEHSPLWCNTLPDNRSMHGFLKDEVKNKRSQDLEKYYRLNGAIYICSTKKLLENKSFILNENIYAYIMPQEQSVDIDTQIDFLLCETILKQQ
jgi:CMP-N,N'-diacetyllegionaminic acid synthase